MRSHARIWQRLVSLSLAAFTCAFVAPRAIAQLEDPNEGARRVPLVRARPVEVVPTASLIEVARDLANGDAEQAARAACAARVLPASDVVPELHAALERWTGRTTDPLARHVVRLVLDALYQLGARLSPEEVVSFVDDDAEIDLALLFAARDPVLHAWNLRKLWPRAGGELQKVCCNLLARGDRDEFVCTLLDELKFELRVTVEDPPTEGLLSSKISCRTFGCGRRCGPTEPPTVVAGVAVPVYTFQWSFRDNADTVAAGATSFRVERSEVNPRRLPSLAPRVRTFDADYALRTLRGIAGDLALPMLRAELPRVVHQGRDAASFVAALTPVYDALAADWRQLLGSLCERGVISAGRAHRPIPLTLAVDDQRSQPAETLPQIVP